MLAMAAIFIVALGVRLLHWQDSYAQIQLQAMPFQGLTDLYEHEARRKIEQGGILFPSGPVDPADARMIAHPPGYSILMAAALAISNDSEWLLRLAQIIFSAAAAVLVFLIAAEFFPRAVAIIAGSLVALSPHLAYYTIFILPDTLAVVPILLAVYLVIRASKRPRLLTVIAAGAAIGLSCWLRSNALLLAPLLAFISFLLFDKRRRPSYSLALVCAALLVISPITIRNWVVYRQFIPLSLGAGNNLIEGIADYDKESRFGLPMMDTETVKKDAEWHGRRDYRRHLWVPDGIERDRYRFSRGLEVIRSNPGWFFTVMLRRMGFMLRYNDFLPQNRPFNTTIAPAVLAGPNFGHRLPHQSEAEPVWSASPVELIATGTVLSPEARVSLADDGALEVVGDLSAYGEQLASPFLSIEENTDYVLKLAAECREQRAAAKIATADPRITLAAAPLPRRERKKKKQKRARNGEAQTAEPAPVAPVQIPFASGDRGEVRLVLSNDRASGRPLFRLGGAQLYALGPTPYQWTRPARALIRGAQKNIFKTERLLPLVILGAILLALARRGRELLILLAVPAYYLSIHSALHTEYRYILAMHCFLFVMAAVAIYSAACAIKGGIRRAIKSGRAQG